LVRAAQACYDIARVYGAPFISGKDSLYNEYDTETGSICIPPTLLVSAMAVMDDIGKVVSMDCKKAGDLIYIVGATYNELGGSHYLAIHGFIGNNVPKVYPEKGKKLMEALASATQKGLVAACHDLSEGGIGVAAAEMAFAGVLGMKIKLENVPLGESVDRDDFILFSESNTRFLVEIDPKNKKGFENTLSGVAFAEIGSVIDDKKLEVYGSKGDIVLSADISELKEAWQKPLRW
jgi:phosphoribosylformylglycinamidine (FGAM) synthase-like enzyme